MPYGDMQRELQVVGLQRWVNNQRHDDHLSARWRMYIAAKLAKMDDEQVLGSRWVWLQIRSSEQNGDRLEDLASAAPC